MSSHRMGLIQAFENTVKKYRGQIGRCLCCEKVLMFFTPYEGTSFLRDDRSLWPWEEANLEWVAYWEKSEGGKAV